MLSKVQKCKFILSSFLDLRSTIFRFCVKFYPPDPALLQEEYTRYCNFIIWLALWVCKMKQILQCDWLPGLATWFRLVALHCMLCPARTINLLKPIMHVHCIIDVNPLLTLEACLVNIGLALFCVYMDLESVSYWPIANHLDLMHGQ